MKTLLSHLTLLTLLLTIPMWVRAAPAPISYSRQILPVFKTQCLSCHSGSTPASGYSMETRDKLVSGGRHGAAVVVGKGGESQIVKYMTGELKPKMPPGGAMDLEKIALIRRWIDEGAKVDSLVMPESGNRGQGTGNRKVFNSQLSTLNSPSPVTALTYSPDGATLAVGGFRAVRLLNPSTGEVMKTVSGCADQVQCLAWSSDGKFLAAAGGEPGKIGEIVIFDTEAWKPVRKLEGHTEVVYAVAWKPNTHELATGSLDKTARVWNGDTGQCTRTIKDHAEGVMGVAYSPDGKLLATGSLDRSAKIFDTATWKRQSALTAHQEGITHVAFNQNGTRLATSSLDKTIRVWTIKPGTIENPDRTMGEGDSINACVFSPDGNLLVWGASNNVVKVFNGDGTQQKREWKDPTDWVYSIAIGKDNQTVAAGTQDGKLLFWNAQDGKLIRQITLQPQGKN